MKIKLNQGYETEKDGVKIILSNSPQVQKELKKRQQIKQGILYGILAALLITFAINILFLPATGGFKRVDGLYTDPSANETYITNFFAETDKLPMVSAHRAGGGEYPEETWMAFKNCLKDGKVDILEFDLHLSKDNKLILLHDHELDRTSNSVEMYGKGKKVKDLTLEEMEKLNMGYNFKDSEGEYIYRNYKTKDEYKNVGIKILELHELFGLIKGFIGDEKFKELKFIIEIKDGGQRGKDAMDFLYKEMEDQDIIDNVVLGTFKQEITDYIDKQVACGNYNKDTHRSAGILDVLNFYYSFLYGTKPNNKFDVMELPEKLCDGFYDLSTPEFMNYAHKYGVALQYWTINDEQTMRKLLQNGADAIITDEPNLAYDVIQDMRATYEK